MKFKPDDTSSNILKTKQGITWMTPDGIFCSYSFEGAPKPTPEEEAENLDNFIAIVGEGTKVKFVLDIDVSQQTNKEEREKATELLNDLTEAMALVCTKPLSRMAAKMFFGINPPTYPVRIFKTHEEALEWIRSL